MFNIRNLKGYKKISHVGGSLVTVVMFNPESGDVKHVRVRDYDYEDIYGGMSSSELTPHEKDELYDMDIDKEAAKEWKFRNNVPYEGCEVEVVRGRKYNHGDRGKVVRMYDYKDRYGRFVAEYIITDNGIKINRANVKVVGR